MINGGRDLRSHFGSPPLLPTVPCWLAGRLVGHLDYHNNDFAHKWIIEDNSLLRVTTSSCLFNRQIGPIHVSLSFPCFYLVFSRLLSFNCGAVFIKIVINLSIHYDCAWTLYLNFSLPVSFFKTTHLNGWIFTRKMKICIIIKFSQLNSLP